MKMTKSFTSEDVKKKWFLVDLEGVVLGRAAARIASILRGKTKPEFTPHDDTGDFVVAVNAGKILLTGSKPEKKIYRKHTGYLGHLREKKAKDLLREDPTFPIRKAIKGMLPRGVLGRKMLRKLKVYAGAVHPHEAQQPEKIAI